MKYFLFIFIIFACSCNSVRKDSIAVKKFMMPQYMEQLYEGKVKDLKIDSLVIKDSSLIILIDGDCYSCFSKLKNWEELIVGSNLNAKFNVFVIVQTNDLLYFREYIYPNLGINMPIFIDYDNQISELNKFIDFMDNRVILFNRDNTIEKDGGIWMQGEIYDYLLSL